MVVKKKRWGLFIRGSTVGVAFARGRWVRSGRGRAGAWTGRREDKWGYGTKVALPGATFDGANIHVCEDVEDM